MEQKRTHSDEYTFYDCVNAYLTLKGWHPVYDKVNEECIGYIRKDPPHVSASTHIGAVALHVQLVMDLKEFGNVDQFANFVRKWHT